MSANEDAKVLGDAIRDAIVKFEKVHPNLMVEDVNIDHLESSPMGRSTSYTFNSVSLRIVLV